MKSQSQLTHLILSFYREDYDPLEQLMSLQDCKVTRWWGVMRIDCPTVAIAEELVRAADILLEPIAQLRLAQRINVLVKGSLLTALPVDPSKLNT